MTWNSLARETLTVVVALLVVATIASTPAAAAQDDGGLLDGDDGDDGGLLSNTTDPVTDTGDSTVSTTEETVGSATDGTGDGATEPVTDAVSSATETVGAGDVTGPTDASQLVPVVEDVGDGSLPDGSLPDGSLPGGPGDLSSVVDTFDGEKLHADDLPADPSTVLEPANETLPTGEDAPVQPEALPYGSEGTGLNDACSLPADEEDLPLEAVPGPGALPVQPSVPGVPINLLTPETVAGIALAAPPRPCEVYDPHDPGFDPTEPPTDPSGFLYNRDLDVTAQEVDWFADSEAALQEGGPGYDGIWRVKATRERVVVAERFGASDGATSDYLGLDSSTGGNLTDRTAHGRFTATVFGKNVGAGLACDGSDAANVSLDEPAQGCDYSLEGVVTPPAGPGDLVDLVRNPPSDPPVDGLPPVGSLPGNAGKLLSL